VDIAPGYAMKTNTQEKDLESFCATAKKLGAANAVVISPQQVVTAEWVRLRCQYGCSEFGLSLTCPPHSPTPSTTRKMLDEYQTAILLHSDNGQAVKEIARELEKVVFLAGYYKAFSFQCGPCCKCRQCVVLKSADGKPLECRHPDIARPAMEAAGIDVYATAHAAGLPLEVVRTAEDRQNYYSLVLVE
jgi:predicted metal-binding protein